MPRFGCLLVCVVALLGPAAVAAEPVQFSIAGTPDACLDETALRTAVVGKLRRDPFRADAAVQIVVSVERTETTAAAKIERIGEAGTRGERLVELTDLDCAAALETTALSLAIVIEPAWVGNEPVREPTPAPRPAVVPPTRPAPAPAWSAWVGVGGLVAIGAGPSTALGADLQLGVRRGRVSLSVEGRLDRESELPIDGGVVAGASRLVVGVACFHTVVRACVVGGGGTLRGESRGISNPRSDSSGIAVVGGRIASTRTLAGPVTLVVHADLLVNAVRTEFAIDDEVVWETAQIQALIGAGIEVRFF